MASCGRGGGGIGGSTRSIGQLQLDDLRPLGSTTASQRATRPASAGTPPRTAAGGEGVGQGAVAARGADGDAAAAAAADILARLREKYGIGG